MKNRHHLRNLFLFTLLLGMLACESEIKQTAPASPPIVQAMNNDIIIENDHLCLVSTESCEYLVGRLVAVRLENGVLKMRGIDGAFPDPEFFPAHDNFIPIFGGDVNLELYAGRLEVSQGANYLASLDLSAGREVGFIQNSYGVLGIIKPVGKTTLSVALANGKCAGNYSIKRNAVDPSQVIISGAIGVEVIVDAFDTLTTYLRRLMPPKVAGLPALEFKFPRLDVPYPLDPPPLDPQMGNEYYLIDGAPVMTSLVNTCSLPCPVKLTIVNGWATITDNSGQTCTAYLGNYCEVNVLAKGGYVSFSYLNSCQVAPIN